MAAKLLTAQKKSLVTSKGKKELILQVRVEGKLTDYQEKQMSKLGFHWFNAYLAKKYLGEDKGYYGRPYDEKLHIKLLQKIAVAEEPKVEPKAEPKKAEPTRDDLVSHIIAEYASILKRVKDAGFEDIDEVFHSAGC